jgi:hypothetical protein
MPQATNSLMLTYPARHDVYAVETNKLSLRNGVSKGNSPLKFCKEVFHEVALEGVLSQPHKPSFRQQESIASLPIRQEATNNAIAIPSSSTPGLSHIYSKHA